ncbi:myelin basic protein isoform X3 [Maylandia zebra]|uniref:Myelin basic protein n=3 Tax=Haplochromini TaxID=319058 RepID=A0A3Q2VJM2_HAPBU|nr:myelin basic protein isoform X3 [Haplochromis burtoni]XP_012778915.1 myelin basic protein isoform X3 [Maylandia zebra]XP_026041033.1 myelin basic protein-like isoform X3 [Astatotilapia calliptera]XP_039869245.1 myelin basic protein-like isoform X3 [Simochromis diagramma]
MASASSSAQAAFGLGRRKKNPGLLDQIGKFFGGDKKRKGKGSFRGALSPGPQKASATSPRKRGAENAVVHFFRTIVSPAPPKSRGPQKSQSAKGKKASAGDGKGTLTRIFKMGSRSASPAKR